MFSGQSPPEPSLCLLQLPFPTCSETCGLPTPLLVFQMPHLCRRSSPFISKATPPLFAQPLPERARPSTSGHLRQVSNLSRSHLYSKDDAYKSPCLFLQIIETLTNRDFNHKESCLLRSLEVAVIKLALQLQDARSSREDPNSLSLPSLLWLQNGCHSSRHHILRLPPKSGCRVMVKVERAPFTCFSILSGMKIFSQKLFHLPAP